MKPFYRVPALCAELSLLRAYLIAASIEFSITEGGGLVVKTRDDAEFKLLGNCFGKALTKAIEPSEGVLKTYGFLLHGMVQAGKSTLVREAGRVLIGRLMENPTGSQETLVHGGRGNDRQIVLIDASRLGAFTYGAYYEYPVARAGEVTFFAQEHDQIEADFVAQKCGFDGDWRLRVRIECPDDNPMANTRTVFFDPLKSATLS